jgi:hypothetical protein
VRTTLRLFDATAIPVTQSAKQAGEPRHDPGRHATRIVARIAARPSGSQRV